MRKSNRSIAVTGWGLALCLLCLPAHGDDPGVILGAEDDLTVSGTNGTSADADLEVKGYSVFGASGSGATAVTQGVGNVYIAGKTEVGSNLYVNGRIGVGTAAPQYDLEVSGPVMMQDSSAPTPSAGHSGVYSSGGELHAIDSAGNSTQLSPHDPNTGEWIFYSKNLKTGRTVKVDMERLVREIEKLTGKNFMEEWVWNEPER
jgi:hypothetical protein